MPMFFSSLLLTLLTCSFKLQAQDSLATFNPVLKDSLLKEELLQVKNQLYHLLLQEKQSIEINFQSGEYNYNFGNPINVYLATGGLNFICPENRTAEIRFSDMTDYKFKIYRIENNIQSGRNNSEQKLKMGNIILSVGGERQSVLKTIASHLIKIQKILNELYFKMNTFRQMAMITNALSNKPYITEEMRQYIIQAETYTKLYEYERAIQINDQLIATHPTAYSDVYYNIAILLAETNKLHSAICNMKKFLLLNPTSEDAQLAKTKITEWELILNN